jgi:hypothetical protein
MLINGAPVRVVRLSPGSITVVLAHPREALSVTIARPAIIEQPRLVTQIRRTREYNRTHRRKRALTVSIRSVVTDTTNHSTRIILKTKLS